MTDSIKQLVPLHSQIIGGRAIRTVNARDLHAFLKVGRDFSTWIKDRVTKFGFVEGQDYVTGVSPNSGENLVGGRPSVEYHLSLDMGKELGMVENNDRGREVRRYFIEMERAALNARDPIEVLNDPAAMRGLLLTYSERVIELEADVAEMTPKAAALDRIAAADGSMCLTDAAKHLQMRPRDLISWLKGAHWIYRRAGNGHWIGYQDKIQSGYLEHKVTEVSRSDGSEKITEQCRVTAKGLAKLAEKLAPNALPLV